MLKRLINYLLPRRSRAQRDDVIERPLCADCQTAPATTFTCRVGHLPDQRLVCADCQAINNKAWAKYLEE